MFYNFEESIMLEAIINVFKIYCKPVTINILVQEDITKDHDVPENTLNTNNREEYLCPVPWVTFYLQEINTELITKANTQCLGVNLAVPSH